MRVNRIIIAGVAATAMMGFYGCGSNFDSASSTTETNATQQKVEALGFVGSNKCIECHEGFTWSSDAVSKYLAGKHVIHSDHVSAASGETCLQCHDPIGDGPLIEGKINAANVPAAGLAAVGCENCHGTGKDHWGSGPIPKARPDAATCGQCHDKQWNNIPEAANHIIYHPEGNNIYSEYAAGPHSAAPGTHNGSPCSKCHTAEGAKMYKDIHTVEGLVLIQPVENASPIQCSTCHDPHNPGKLLEAEVTSGRGASLKVVKSAEYATCTNCHQPHDAQIADVNGDGVVDITTLPGSTSTDGASGGLIYHAARYNRVISSTHYDNPATAGVVEGYIVKANDARACRDCHNVHSADITINEQWAKSGHGGEILEAKEKAVADAGLTDHDTAAVAIYRAAGTTAAANAFVHYDWDSTNDRGDCQKCHSATGLKNYLTNPAGYNKLNNDFSHLAGWSKDPVTGSVTPSAQNELLFCWGCHSNNQGKLRNPGAIDPAYTFTGVAVTLPNISGSNVCVVCHAGRGNYDTLVTGSRSSRYEGHHGTAASTIFSKEIHPGYEFKDATGAFLQYDSTIKTNGATASFKHRDIGTLNADGTPYSVLTGTSGPCVGCHMGPTGTAQHEFKLAGLRGGTCGTSADGVAGACHATMTEAVLEEESADYQQALTLLNNYLTQAGGYTNYLATNIVTGYNTVEMDAYGAFQNYKYLTDEPAAYVHNRKYARRLVFDSIDKLDNGVLDGTITINMANFPLAGAWLGANADTGVALRY